MKLQAGLNIFSAIWPQNGSGPFYSSCGLHKALTISVQNLKFYTKVITVQPT